MGKYKKLQKLQLENEKRLDKIEKHLALNTEVSVSQANPEEHNFEWLKPKSKSVNEYDFEEEIKYDGKFSRHHIVFENLFEQAKKLGFENGIKIKNHQGEFTLNVFNLESMRISNHYNQGFWIYDEKQPECKGIWILINGVWADIIRDYDFKTPEIEGIKKPALGNTDTNLSIREVQVKVTSQEEANECAEIAKACGEKVGDEYSMKYFPDSTFFRQNTYYKFGVYGRDRTKTEISIQEYRELFGKSTEIDWSKTGQYLTNGFIVVMTMEESNKTNEGNFRGVCVYKEIEKEWEDEVGQYSNNWIRSNFKLCTEPITIKN